MKQRGLFGFIVLATLASLAIACLGQVGSSGWAGPVRLGEVTLVSTKDGRLDAVDGEGQRVWRFPDQWQIADGSADDLDGIYGTPLTGSYDGKDVVFVGDFNGFVYAFRPGDASSSPNVSGEPPAAFFELDGAVIGGLALDMAGDALYVTSGNRVYALRASDLVRKIENRDAQVGTAGPTVLDERPGVLFVAGDDIWGEPVLVDDKLLVNSLDGNLYAIDPATGAEIWRFEAEQGLVSTPTVVGDLVLVAGFGSKLFGVSLADGSERWTFEAKHWIWGKPAVDGDIAYIGDFDGVVHAVDLNSGTAIWSLTSEYGPLRASPALSGGMLVVSSDDGWLAGINLATRSVAWQRQIDTKLNADLVANEGQVLIAPRGCVTPEGATEKVYYTKVDPSNGELTLASGIC